MPRPFLTARWEDLLLLNYACPRELLEPLVPAGTRLDPESGGEAEYGWSHADRRFQMRGTARGAAVESPDGSEAEFITEHYWGYTRRRDGSTAEYRVEHPRWKVWEAESPSFSGDAGALYGSEFAEILAGEPRSAFLAVGSEVAVYPGQRIEAFDEDVDQR